jgi:hypothetical protein
VIEAGHGLGLSERERVTLYHHCDGYPSGMLPLFAEAFEKFREEGWKLRRAGHIASFLCATDPGGFEPEPGHELHGDIEYYYRLYTMNEHGGSADERGRWEVEVFSVEFDDATPENPGKLLLARTEVEEAAMGAVLAKVEQADANGEV